MNRLNSNRDTDSNKESKGITHTEKILVAKLGGSLLMDLKAISENLFKNIRESIAAKRYDRVIIVAGGGVFADAVRDLNLDDETAHWMAILSMEEYALYVSSFGIPAVDFTDADSPNTSNSDAHFCLLLPYCLMRKYDPLPHSWDITSDSIAAWVAYAFREGIIRSDVNAKSAKSAESAAGANTAQVSLLLLKSVDGIKKRSDGCDEDRFGGAQSELIRDLCADNAESLAFHEEVDPYLIPFVLREKIDTYVINAKNSEAVNNFFSGAELIGTHIY